MLQGINEISEINWKMFDHHLKDEFTSDNYGLV